MSFHRTDTLQSKSVEFFIKNEVLKFGDFTLKSGRKSPYFFNTGSLCSGEQLFHLGNLYAEAILSEPQFEEATVIFGSAYKGIPISVATAIALNGTTREHMRAVSDRKEAKTHGDKGGFLGVLQPGDKVVIVDDVITDGATKFEALEKLREAGAEPVGFIIAFDRAEPVQGSSVTAREAFEEKSGLPVIALASIHDVMKVKPELTPTFEGYLASIAG